MDDDETDIGETEEERTKPKGKKGHLQGFPLTRFDQ